MALVITLVLVHNIHDDMYGWDATANFKFHHHLFTPMQFEAKPPNLKTPNNLLHGMSEMCWSNFSWQISWQVIAKLLVMDKTHEL